MSTKLKTLQRLLRSSPPHLTRDKDGSTSTSTHPPTFFDLHMDDLLVAKKTIHLPNLVNDISSLVDTTLQGISEYGSYNTVIAILIKKLRQLQAAYALVRTSMMDEKSVVQVYEKSTAKFCPSMAFLLVFCTTAHVTASDVLLWTPESSQRINAIADGYFKINVAELDKVRDTLPLEVVQELDRVLHCFPDMATWEFKSLTVAPKQVLEAIVKIAKDGGTFCWICCTSQMHCNCKAHYTLVDSRSFRTVTGARVGFDAQNLDVKLPSPSEPTKGQLPEPQKDDKVSRGTKRKRGDEALKPLHIMQQGWSQAVKKDVTYFVYNAGNYEIICIRHRATQTVYVSDIIKTSDPGYAKLHIGLEMAILRDAIERARLWTQAEIDGTLPTQSSYHLDSETETLQTDSEADQPATEDSEKLYKEVYASRYLMICSASKVESPQIVFPKTLSTREGSLGFQSDIRDPSVSPARVTVILDEKIDMFNYKATLEVGDTAFLRHALLARLAFGRQRKQLMSEVGIYTHLYSRGVVDCIPDVLGVFHAEPEGLVFFTRNVGKTLAERKRLHFPSLTEDQRSGFHHALDKIYESGVVFEDLDSISEANLLADEHGRIWITDFSEATIIAASQTGIADVDEQYSSRLVKNKLMGRARLNELLQEC